MNLIIDYLTEQDRSTIFYNKFLESLDMNDLHIKVDSKQGFIGQLHQRNLDGYKHLTILTHGVQNQDFISKDGLRENALSYKELVDTLNTIVGNGLILNIIGICHSIRIETVVKNLKNHFTEVWVSEDENDSFDAPIRIMRDGFDLYMNLQDVGKFKRL